MLQTKPMILVTGGAGYIGSHIVLALQRVGYEVIVLDNLVNGHQNIVEEVLQVKLIVGDIGDRELLARLFVTYPITAVMHFAAYIAVGESVTEPSKYYCDRRPGDPPVLVGSSDKARKILGWQPQYSDLTEILTHAFAWHQQRHAETSQKDLHSGAVKA